MIILFATVLTPYFYKAGTTPTCWWYRCLLHDGNIASDKPPCSGPGLS